MQKPAERAVPLEVKDPLKKVCLWDTRSMLHSLENGKILMSAGLQESALKNAHVKRGLQSTHRELIAHMYLEVHNEYVEYQNHLVRLSGLSLRNCRTSFLTIFEGLPKSNVILNVWASLLRQLNRFDAEMTHCWSSWTLWCKSMFTTTAVLQDSWFTWYPLSNKSVA